MDRDQLVVDKINDVVSGAIEEIKDFRGERTLYIKAGRLKKVCQLLRDDDDLEYNLLSDICADDLLPEFPRFAVSYHLFSIPYSHRLRLRVRVEDPDKGPQSMAAIWPVATWLEMEVWDLMGVRFRGNKSLRRLFLPEDWQGHPLRKDYPLGYEEVQFSFNWEEIGGRKPHPTE
ncbi:MAG: NADH-quinone oxidoreductase subunit C [Anaerolineaceae bacterium]|jgi:NADH-quinone oxidoreductase subunit C|nr:NADH-quinone oxidoreductase subunit C [Chloroflexota bacterium]UCC52518.1 MAG: NADH-quinone oxidoreductase subunit C [Anaerolineaceae bacterium]